jgi:hypothetical protein
MTQMGNNGNGTDGQRRRIEILQSGVLGEISEIHVNTDRPIWPQGISRPEGSDPVPPELAWDCWLGVAPERPFKKDVYHSFKWRGWFDFGTGAMGDIACHAMSFFWRGLNSARSFRETVKTTQKFPETLPHARRRARAGEGSGAESPVRSTGTTADGAGARGPPEGVGHLGSMPAARHGCRHGPSSRTTRSAERRAEVPGHRAAQRDEGYSGELPRVKNHHWEFAESVAGARTVLAHRPFDPADEAFAGLRVAADCGG